MRHDYRGELIEETRTFASVALHDAADFLNHLDLERAHLKILLAQQRMGSLKELLEN